MALATIDNIEKEEMTNVEFSPIEKLLMKSPF